MRERERERSQRLCRKRRLQKRSEYSGLILRNGFFPWTTATVMFGESALRYCLVVVVSPDCGQFRWCSATCTINFDERRDPKSFSWVLDVFMGGKLNLMSILCFFINYVNNIVILCQWFSWDLMDWHYPACARRWIARLRFLWSRVIILRYKSWREAGSSPLNWHSVVSREKDEHAYRWPLFSLNEFEFYCTEQMLSG